MEENADSEASSEASELWWRRQADLGAILVLADEAAAETPKTLTTIREEVMDVEDDQECLDAEKESIADLCAIVALVHAHRIRSYMPWEAVQK